MVNLYDLREVYLHRKIIQERKERIPESANMQADLYDLNQVAERTEHYSEKRQRTRA